MKRAVLTGFIFGAIVTVVVLLAARYFLVTGVSDEVAYHFYTCVFDGTDFPDGDIDNGRALRRALVAVHITTTFYDAEFHEVKHADHPGRYGAVVRIDINGSVSHRFITLYRTPQRVLWDVVAIPITAQLPPELGLDPTVIRNQQPEIGSVLALPFKNEDGRIPEEIAVLLAGLSETAPGDPPAHEHDNAAARDAEWWHALRKRIGLAQTYRYLIDLPRDYDAKPDTRWPLILFLDHAGDTGNDLNLVRHSALPGLIAQGKQLPAVVVSPQCPANQSWSTPVLAALLDEVEKKYRIDEDRIYLTGISAGGDETWDFALAHPERLAAIVPICGESDPTDAARLQHLPVWAFHGEKDDIVPVVQTIRMVDAIKQSGGHPHVTLFADAGHDAWDQAYALEPLYAWLLAQRRGQPEVLTPGAPGP